MDDTLIKILVAILGGSGIGGAVVAYVTRRTPDASQQQVSQDAFYARINQREADAQKALMERENYWLAREQEWRTLLQTRDQEWRNLLQSREQEWRTERKQLETQLDTTERQCVLCEAREQGYKDRIDGLHSQAQQLTAEIERLRRGRM